MSTIKRKPRTRCYLTMFKQILQALKHSENEIVYFCEHDVWYTNSHFDFTPPDKNKFYYNTNVIKLDVSTGNTLKVDDCRQVSGICVYRDLAIKHYTKRLEMIESYIKKNGEEKLNSYIRAIGFEPATHNRNERVDDLKSEVWKSKLPIIDIRHDGNLTKTKWKKEQFRNQKYTKGWTEGGLELIPDGILNQLKDIL